MIGTATIARHAFLTLIGTAFPSLYRTSLVNSIADRASLRGRSRATSIT